MSRDWSLPAELPALDAGDVHVWRFALDESPSLTGPLEPILSSDERRRAQLFRRERDRTQYMWARIQLRGLLGGYLGYRGRDVRFEYGANGKPRLSTGGHNKRLRFNLSHSGELAVCAVSCSAEVGVDVECAHPAVDFLAIAQRYFGAREVAALAALPVEEARQCFFRLWTRKEALAKAQGTGVWKVIGLDLLMVESTPLDRAGGETPSAVVHGRWHVYDLSPATGFLGAVAHEGSAHRLASYQWPLAWSTIV
jgi:4'-phosphopantetheinyl transferase